MLKLLKLLLTMTHLSFNLQFCASQFSLLQNIPLFNSNNNFQTHTRAKKSPTASTTTTAAVKCCVMIQVSSEGAGKSVHPDRMGVYRLVTDIGSRQQAVYKHIGSKSFIFKWNFPEGNRWIIGDDVSQNSFVITSNTISTDTRGHCPAYDDTIKDRPSRKRHLSNARQKRQQFDSRQKRQQSDVRRRQVGGSRKGPNFQVFDGNKLILDESLKISCLDVKMEMVEGCCSSVRVASSNKDSLSMEYQRRRLGPYQAIGSMNEKLVYQKLGTKSDETSYIYFWRMDSLRHLWYIGTNYSSSVHGVESSPFKDSGCVTDVTTLRADQGQVSLKVFTRAASHILDPISGWQEDFSLRIECFDFSKQCCSFVEVSSQDTGSAKYPSKMGTYHMLDQITLSGRRAYKQLGGQNYIYLYDFGPGLGMRWIFGSFLGEENGQIRSENVENAYPLNVCLYDATMLGQFQVWDNPKWQRDPTLKIQCTHYY